MQIEEGKYYMNRLGDKVGPIIPNPGYDLDEGATGEKYPWYEDELGQSFTDRGRVGFDTRHDNEYDLIEEWTE